MTEHTPMAEQVRDAVTTALGQFRDIGIGPERDDFREVVVSEVLAAIGTPVTDGGEHDPMLHPHDPASSEWCPACPAPEIAREVPGEH